MEELLSLKWNNHKSTFIKVIGELKTKHHFSDVTLACNGKFYKVHKFILSSCSDYFASILENTDCSHPVIVLADISSLLLESLLDYMYLGELNVEQNELPNLLKLAENFGIKGLAIPDIIESPKISHNLKRKAEDKESKSKTFKRSASSHAKSSSSDNNLSYKSESSRCSDPDLSNLVVNSSINNYIGNSKLEAKGANVLPQHNSPIKSELDCLRDLSQAAFSSTNIKQEYHSVYHDDKAGFEQYSPDINEDTKDLSFQTEVQNKLVVREENLSLPIAEEPHLHSDATFGYYHESFEAGQNSHQNRHNSDVATSASGLEHTNNRQGSSLLASTMFENYLRPMQHHTIAEVVNKSSNTRRRCVLCYRRLQETQGRGIARRKAKLVNTYCPHCPGNPFLCLSCFGDFHVS